MEQETPQNNQNNPNNQVNKSNVNTGLISLEIVARMNNIDIDNRAIVREFGITTADIEPEEIIRIAKSRSFKIKKKKMSLEDIPENYPMPAILQLKDNSYIVLLGINHEEKKALTLVPLAKSPEATDLDELQDKIKDFITL